MSSRKKACETFSTVRICCLYSIVLLQKVIFLIFTLFATFDFFTHAKLHRAGRRPLLSGTQDFTILIKNSIEFPAFGPAYRRRNIDETATESYLQSCINDRKTDPYCPTFRLGDIVKWAGEDYDKVALTGAVFVIKIEWLCDFDWGRSISNCKPKYSFQRMDNPNAKVAPGFNYRYVCCET